MRIPPRRIRSVLPLFALALFGLLPAGCGSGSGGAGETDWPLFGRIPQRTHYLPAKGLDPPFEEVWSFEDTALLEFPPALVGDRLYVADKNGNLRALDAETGDVVWERSRTGSQADGSQPADVTAPTFVDGRVVVAFEHGEVVAFDADSGKPEWTTTLPSRLESSPISVGQRIYLGSDKGVLYGLRTADGSKELQFQARAPIKSSPSYDDGRLYFGDYGGTVYALSAETGKRVWKTDSTATPPGGSGGFYSSPSVAGGKLYAGRDDGTVFAFDAESGRYAWSYATGGAVYGSPAVAPVPGSGLTVFVGSYDASLYALDAGSGKLRWKEVVGPVPGTATVIDHTVYTSSFKTGNTIGLDTRTRERVFRFSSPGYTPMISDGVRVFLAGYESVHAFEPKPG